MKNKLYKLEELCLSITVGFVGSMAKEYIGKGVPLLRSLNIKPYYIDLKDIKYISNSFHQQIIKSSLNQGDVVIVRTGQPGVSCVIPEGFKDLNCSDLVIIRPNTKLVNPHFLSFYFNSSAKKYVDNQLVGAIQQHFNIGSAREMVINLPNLENQDRVVKILNDINTKIDLNNRINTELEAMAKTLYDYWFVQFDFQNEEGKPYKSSGGKMVWSEELKREIPEGWEVGNILNVGELLGGGTPKTAVPDFWGGHIPFFTPKDVSNSFFVLDTIEHITELGLNNCSSKLYPKGTVFITARGTVGNINIASREMAMNQSCYAIQSKAEINYYYLHQCCIDLVQYLKAKANGSVFDAIVSNDFKLTPIVIPKPETIKQFGHIIGYAYEAILINNKENQHLSQLRDWLLPMLMNGQVKVQ